MSASARPAGLFGGIAPLVGAMAFVCVGNSFAKNLFPVVGANGTTLLRLGVASLILVAVQRPWRWQVGRAEWAAIVPYGAALAGMNVCFYMALRTLPLGIAVAIEFLGPLGVAICYSKRRSDYLWIGCAAAGIAALVLSPSGPHSIDPVGLLFVLGAALFWALYILAGKRASEVLPEDRGVCLGMCVAALIAVPGGVVTAGWALLRPEVLASGAIIAVLASAIPFTLEMMALKRLPRHVFGVIVSLEPAIGALAALAILGERLMAVQWLAIAMLVAASIGISRHSSAPETFTPPA